MRRFAYAFSRLGLQYKFILITTFAIILSMSLLGYLAVQREKAVLYRTVEIQGHLLGETLAIPIINDLIYERLGLVEEGGLLDNYIGEIYRRQDTDLLYIAILDEDGGVISHNDITQYGSVYSDLLTARALKSSETIVQRFAVEGNEALDFGVPLSIGKKRWGTLKFGISLKKVEEEIAAMVRRIITFTLFLLAAGFAMIILLSRRFIRPITQLANTMEKTSGDYLDVKVEVSGHDELAVLGERFNSMIERIRQANEELRKTHEKLVQSEKLASIGILAAGVAHEINNPLGGIFNCLRMLRQNGDTPEMREKYLSLVGEGLERIESTVSKLLWMSRKSGDEPVEVNVKNAVESVYYFLDYRMTKGRIHFVNRVDEDLVLIIDLHDFQQAVLNLFINAIHAMPEGGMIEIDGRREGTAVCIEVTDTGCGISDENMGKIYDPFFTTKAPGEGTGLGLWLTYQIVKNYNGEISVESEIGKGCRFTMKFPGRQIQG